MRALDGTDSKWSLAFARSTGHHKGWVSSGTAKVAQTARCQHDDAVSIREDKPVNLRLDILDLDASATAEDVRAAYKSLVKKLHPDANGGDRKHEERLQRVIKAHEYLKASGFC